jgi:peroxiredoxin
MKSIIICCSKIFFLFASLFLITLSTLANDGVPRFKNGDYQFKIHRQDGQDIVFNTLVKDSLGKKIMYVINGNNRLLVDSIIYKNDSIRIELPFYESGFVAKISANGNLTGQWIKRAAEKERRMPFTATYGERRRYLVSSPPKNNISGRWEVQFMEDGKPSPSVGEFVQKGSKLTGTFLTPYGDYRFLEGVISGDSLYLSGFDGSYALSFKATIRGKNKITNGQLFSGAAAPQQWSAFRNRKAQLPDGYSMSHVKPNSGKMNFSFPDMDGNMVSNTDARFKNKVVVIQILGSWCPNCVDETKFITDNFQFYKDMGVEFIGLAYERTADYATSKKALESFRKRFNPQYPILIAPVALSDPMMTEKTLPQIDKISAFPSTIFLDKKGNIRKIHAGFDGPATGIHYIQFKEEFDALLKDLVNE